MYTPNQQPEQQPASGYGYARPPPHPYQLPVPQTNPIGGHASAISRVHGPQPKTGYVNDRADPHRPHHPCSLTRSPTPALRTVLLRHLTRLALRVSPNNRTRRFSHIVQVRHTKLFPLMLLGPPSRQHTLSMATRVRIHRPSDPFYPSRGQDTSTTTPRRPRSLNRSPTPPAPRTGPTRRLTRVAASPLRTVQAYRNLHTRRFRHMAEA
ncbi:hypothetical protein EDB84DRAFT_63859 [Lactarius hengduanensis]|nr:hypothetical protein EDB84DRAFT_63859 [Lactarius hengduanensis]